MIKLALLALQKLFPFRKNSSDSFTATVALLAFLIFSILYLVLALFIVQILNALLYTYISNIIADQGQHDTASF